MSPKTPKLTNEEIRGKLAGIATNTPIQSQKVTPVQGAKKIGRKSHLVAGLEYERLGVKVPAELKNEMAVAMRTTHKEYKTMDLFVAEAMRVFLNIKR